MLVVVAPRGRPWNLECASSFQTASRMHRHVFMHVAPPCTSPALITGDTSVSEHLQLRPAVKMLCFVGYC